MAIVVALSSSLLCNRLPLPQMDRDHVKEQRGAHKWMGMA